MLYMTDSLHRYRHGEVESAVKNGWKEIMYMYIGKKKELPRKDPRPSRHMCEKYI